MKTIKNKLGQPQSVCDCGKTLQHKATIIKTNESRTCPKCGKEYYIENPPIDWDVALSCKGANVGSV